jgi:16S rRNA (guanine1207-N2)-methyltransferase
MGAKGRALQFLTGEGVFSRSGLDEGSRLLIETIDLEPGSSFCDLGCGWGAVGAFIGHSFPQTRVFACDVNARAVQLARFNLELNKVKNAVAWCDDGLSATRPELFDAIACNPPIRAGNPTIFKLFADAERGLKVGGSLWIVIRTAQGAKSWQKRLEAQFGECETLLIKNGYRILRAVRQS